MYGLAPFRGSRPVRYEGPFSSFCREAEAMFDRSFPGALLAVPTEGNPIQLIRADVRETDSEYVIEAELPGFDKEEIDVEVSDGYLTIKAERKEEVNESDKGYIRRERKYRSAARSFYIDGVDQAEVKASHDNGILKLVLPKQAESSTTRRIAIE